MKWLVLFSLLSLSAFGADKVVSYAPDQVTLAGTLDFGAPAGATRNAGRQYYLHLDEPVTVRPSAKAPAAKAQAVEKNVRVLQLAVGAKDAASAGILRKLGKGARVRIRGVLFHARSPQDHSRVLLSVAGVEPAAQATGTAP